MVVLALLLIEVLIIFPIFISLQMHVVIHSLLFLLKVFHEIGDQFGMQAFLLFYEFDPFFKLFELENDFSLI